MIAYVDSSVLIRILFGQDGQLAQWRSLEEAFGSELVRAETLRTIDRISIRGQIDPGLSVDRRIAALEMIASMHLMPVETEVLERAGDPFPTALRTLDAIHLATALALRPEYPHLSFATHDAELALGARSVGFSVLGT